MNKLIRDSIPAGLRRTCRESQKSLRKMRWALGQQTAVCDVRGLRIKLGVSSELERFRAATYSTKEPETLSWIEGNLRDGDVMFDIGANIGVYTLFAAKLNPGCTVYAFEPESQNYARLCNNIVLNQLPNVIPCNAPLADRQRLDYFYVGNWQAGASLHSFGKPLAASGHVLRQAAIAASLDCLVNTYGLPQPNLIKVDVDGIEDQIIAGADEVLKSTALRSLLIEISIDGDNGKDAAMIAKLQRAGLRIASKGDWIYEEAGVKFQNFILNRGEG